MAEPVIALRGSGFGLGENRPTGYFCADAVSACCSAACCCACCFASIFASRTARRSAARSLHPHIDLSFAKLKESVPRQSKDRTFAAAITPAESAKGVAATSAASSQIIQPSHHAPASHAPAQYGQVMKSSQ